MKDETECGQQVRSNDQLGDTPECTCSAKDMTFGRCCKLDNVDTAFSLLVAAYEKACGVTAGKFAGLTEREMERFAYAGFADFASGWRMATAEAVKAIAQSQPTKTTSWDCIDAIQRKMTPND